jgi:hypothetical protein
MSRDSPSLSGIHLTDARQIAALIASRQQARVGELYQHLILKKEYAEVDARKNHVRRLHEAMIKCIFPNGIHGLMEAFQSLASVEQSEDQDHSFTFTRYVRTPTRSINAARILTACAKGRMAA